MNGFTPEVEQALVEALEELPWVDFAMLFGSTARGEARANSDVDVAVRISPRNPPAAPLFALLGPCNRAVGAGRLHLVLFDHAPVLLRQLIFEEGRVLFERDPAQRMHCQAQTLREVFDLPAERRVAEHFKLLRETDPDSLTRKLGALHALWDQLEPFTRANEAEFVATPEVHHLAERYLHLSAEAMLDIALHFVLDHGGRTPSSAADTFAVLLEAGAAAPEQLDRWQRWMRLRSKLLHGYMDLDHAANYAFLRDNLDDLSAFLEWAGRKL
ncbi:MAG: HepT-like ribonuclease domain-containing protein [Candidatus Eremiobacterota bacterium]